MAARTLYPNRASDPRFQARLLTDLYPFIRRTRDDRQVLNQTWLRYWNVWSGVRDQQSYSGRSRTYLATGRRLIENWVHKLKRDLFAADPWWTVVPDRQAYAPRVPGLNALFRHYFEKQMQLRRHATPWLRQLVTLGTSPIQLTWKLSKDVIPVLKDLPNDGGTLTPRQERKLEEVIRYVGPTWRTVDLFSWYIYPVTCRDVAEADLCFEDQLVDRHAIRRLAHTPIVAGDDQYGYQYDPTMVEAALASSVGQETNKFREERIRLQQKGFTARNDRFDPNRPVDLTHVYWRTDFNDLLDPDDSDYCLSGATWWRITLGSDRIPLRIQRNPYWIGEPNYLVGKFAEIPNEFYGRGLPETFDRLQYFLNDVADQSNDALVWSMNPIAIIDGYEVQDPSSIRMRPGAKWLAKPDAVRFTEPPKDTAAVGFNAVSNMIALMNDMANVAPISGVGSGGGRLRGRALNTAAGAQLLAGENMIQIRDVVENLEDTVFSRLLSWSHVLSLQCLTEPILLRITGEDGAVLIEKPLTASDVVGDFTFQWMGSIHTQNQQVRGQQMVNFLQMVSRIPPQTYQSQGIDIQWGALLRSIWTDGLALRDAPKIIKDMHPTTSIDWRIENELFLLGKGDEVSISQADTDDEHLKGHDQLLTHAKLDPAARAALLIHMRQHGSSKMAKAMMKQMQAQQEMQQHLQPPQGPPGSPGHPPQSPNGTPTMPPPNNPGRMAQTTTPDDLFRKASRGLQ